MNRIEALSPQWPAPANVRAFTTTRAGGVSLPPFESLNFSARTGDERAAVLENRRRLAEFAHLPDEPLWLQQVHGNRLVTHAAGEEPEADASWSDQPGRVCALLTADCLPLLLCDSQGAWVAALHCGWRGLAGGIIESVTGELPRSDSVLAWMGPAIGPRAFEVGAEVRAEFMDAGRAPESGFKKDEDSDQYHADMYAIARHQLAGQGITHVYGGGFCTATDDQRFFSFRRDGDTGRMATLIWRAP